MCVILACPEGIFPSKDSLERIESVNKDGGGIAFKDGKRIKFLKGITGSEMFPLFKNIQSGPTLIHFRKATQGGSDLELCHPFPVTEKCEYVKEGFAPAVLAHNGTWREGEWKNIMIQAMDMKKPIPDGKWSDSRAIAWLTALFGIEFLNLLDMKVAYLSPNYKNVLIFGKGFIEGDDKIKYSNMDWKNKTSSSFTGATKVGTSGGPTSYIDKHYRDAWQQRDSVSSKYNDKFN